MAAFVLKKTVVVRIVFHCVVFFMECCETPGLEGYMEQH